MQDTLRLLTLWFKYGAHDDVSNAMSSGFADVDVDTWLEVIPQVRNNAWAEDVGTYTLVDHRSYPNAE